MEADEISMEEKVDIALRGGAFDQETLQRIAKSVKTAVKEDDGELGGYATALLLIRRMAFLNAATMADKVIYEVCSINKINGNGSVPSDALPIVKDNVKRFVGDYPVLRLALDAYVGSIATKGFGAGGFGACDKQDCRYEVEHTHAWWGGRPIAFMHRDKLLFALQLQAQYPNEADPSSSLLAYFYVILITLDDDIMYVVRNERPSVPAIGEFAWNDDFKLWTRVNQRVRLSKYKDHMPHVIIDGLLGIMACWKVIAQTRPRGDIGVYTARLPALPSGFESYYKSECVNPSAEAFPDFMAEVAARVI